MKRTISRIFCVIMALCVFLTAMPIMSFAEKEKPAFDIEVRESGPVQQYDPSAIIKVNNKAPVANQYFSSGADDMHWFYSYLTNDQKSVYDTVKAAGVCIDKTLTVPLNTAIVGAATVSENTLYLSDEVWTSVFEVALSGITALMDDHPEMFWINSFSYGIANYELYTTDDESVLLIVVTAISVAIKINTAVYANATSVENYYNQLIDAVNKFEVHGITRYEKLKSIHDTIVRQVQYDPNYNNSSKNPTDHEPVSVFTEPFLTVCEGYAEAFKLLCDREGIPCVVVVGIAGGGGHAWNYVKMEDNKWYAVDMTWDDPLNNDVSTVYYNYFLVGSETVVGGATFAEGHVSTGERFSAGSFRLTYPTLATDLYGKVMLSFNVGDITIEDSMNVIFVGKDVTTLQEKFAIPSGFTGGLSSYTDLTGGLVQTTKTATGITKTYIVAKRGDIDGSNTTNITDYDKVVTASTLGSCPEKNTAEYYAGDINHDGAIDGFDAIALDLYLEDTLKFN
ncbi:MAG: hypothetical protein J6Q50_01365 [Clostridia bacterium]|nr:hypothetical protein [Clostridia bacterium]